MGNKIAAGFTLVVLLMLVFQDTAEFRQIMGFLVSGNPALAPPAGWTDNRHYVIICILSLLLVYYRSSLVRYGSAARIYGNQQPLAAKPSISPELASYIFLRDSSLIMAIRLIKWCQSGILKLHHEKSPHPWEIRRTPASSGNTNSDRGLLETLFGDNDRMTINDIASAPHPAISATAAELFAETQEESKHYLQPQAGAAMAWIVLIALLIEIPFFHSYNPELIPGQLFLHICLAAFVAGVTWSLTYLFPFFYTDQKLAPLMAALFGLFLVGMVHYLSSSITAPYLEITLYIDLVAILVILVQRTPLITKDKTLLKGIIDYKNHLQSQHIALSEENLPWLIALQIGSGPLSNPESVPAWLVGNNVDPRNLLGNNPNSLISEMRRAIHGRSKSSSGSSHSSNSGSRL